MSWIILVIVAFVFIVLLVKFICDLANKKNENSKGKSIAGIVLIAIGIVILSMTFSTAQGILDNYIYDVVKPHLFGDNSEDEPDSAPKPDITQPDSTNSNNKQYSVGDTFTFGNYEQDNNMVNGSEPIEWIVLSVEDDRMLVISKFALDCKPYNDTQTEVTWESCTLRKWLNDEFINTAFSKEEQSHIVHAVLDNPENYSWGTDGGNQTVDQIFCLSLEEIGIYFDNSVGTAALASDTAKSRGCYVSPESGYCKYWLRSPGYDQSCAAGIHDDGWMYLHGDDVLTHDTGVRPAFYYSVNATQSESKTSYGNASPFSLDNAYSPGDYFTFGQYEQDNNTENGFEDIEWLVLSVDSKRMLIISRYGLDAVPYNNVDKHTTWANCSLRSWLNNEFLNTAFSDSEIAMIERVIIDNSSHPHFDTEECEPTLDRFFCLSFQEVENMGEVYRAYKHSSPTEYAEANGVYVDTDDSWMWWLRTLGNGETVAACDSNSYKSDTYGSYMTFFLPAVRPVCYIKLDQ